MKSEPRQARARRGQTGQTGELVALREQLAEAQATLSAIRNGDVDAVVVEGKLGLRVYTLEGAEFDYRILIESMNEGALVLTQRGLIVYANAHFALMVERPLTQLIGRSLHGLLSAADQATLRRLLRHAAKTGATTELLLQRPLGAPMPARISIRRLPGNGTKGVSIGMVVSDLTEIRRREELLRCFSNDLQDVHETERLQMATDLGENISQLLCTMLVRCQLLVQRLPIREKGFRDEATEFARLVRLTANEVNRISAELRPHGLEILGLVPALRGVAEEFAERTSVAMKVSCAKLSMRLPPRTELALYRVLQEALLNVEQHAQARHAAVTLKRHGSSVQLAIKDDGVGFDASDKQGAGMQEGRFGLLSMRERATAVGGLLSVKSTAAGGTDVRLDVPFSPEP